MDSSMDSVAMEESVTAPPTSSSWGSSLSRILVLLLGALALTSSVFATFSCQFFSYRSLDGEPWEGLQEPFNDLATASVGLFQYSTSTTSEGGNILFGAECYAYEDWAQASDSKLFYAGQWSSMVAPAAAFLAWIQILFEMASCRLFGGKMWIVLLFLAAFALQACSFLLFADSDFCFEAESVNHCWLNSGAWYSLGATGAYLLLALLSTALPQYPGKASRCGCCVITSSYPADRRDGNDEGADDKPEGDTSDEEWNDISDDSASGNSSHHMNSWLANQDTIDDKEDYAAIMASYNGTQEDDEHTLNDNSVVIKEGPEMRAIYMGDGNEADGDHPMPSAPMGLHSTYPIPTATAMVISSQNRGPDFMDLCCGDPLELEKSIAQENVRRKKIGSSTPRRKRPNKYEPSTVPQPNADHLGTVI